MNSAETEKETKEVVRAEIVEIFCSYSHVDEALWRELEKHLEVLRRQGLVRVWSDRRISAGAEWAGTIDSHLDSAQILLLLISADFLASDYCMDIELTRAITRHNSGEARIVPIILRPVDWEDHPLAKFQALPPHARPITQWPDRDEALREVVIGLRRAIKEFHSSTRSRMVPQAIQAPELGATKASEANRPLKNDAPTGNQGRNRKRKYLTAAGGFLLLALIELVASTYARWHEPSKPSAPAAPPAVRVSQIDGLSYVRIPPGNFLRGCEPRASRCQADAQPQHLLTISHMYWIGQTEVTVKAFRRFTKQTGYPFPPMPESSNYDDFPIVNVTWGGASQYCQWAGGRLPFEAEWAYVAETGQQTEPAQIGWFLNDSGSTAHRVATLPYNNWLLYDVLGNVWEWCLDWYDPAYYRRNEFVDPLGPDKGSRRVIRGGSWKEPAELISTYTRSSLAPDAQADDVGFRCVLETLNTN